MDEPAERASCERFQLVVTNENRVSKYTLWVSRDGQGRAVPRRYLMMGYNTLLGSHFDKYELIYHGFSRKPLPSSVFDITHLISEWPFAPLLGGLPSEAPVCRKVKQTYPSHASFSTP